MAMRRPQLPPLGPLLRLPHLIRFRLTMWYTGLAALVLAAFVGGVYYAFGQYQPQGYADILRQVFQQQVHVGYLPMSHGEHGYPRSEPYYPLYFSDPDAPNKSGYQMMFVTSDGAVLSRPPQDSVLNTRQAKKAQQAATKDASGVPLQTSYPGYRFITIPLSAQGNRVIGQIAVPISHI